MTLAPNWNIVERRGRAGLLQLEADWRRLSGAMPHRTRSHVYEAHLANVDHLMKAPGELRCLTLDDGEQVRAICLLEAREDGILGPPVRAWASPPLRHTRRSDIICAEDDARQAFIPALVSHLRRERRGRRLLVLGPLPEDSVLWEGLRQLGRNRYCTRAVEGEHFLDCSRSFDELMSGLSSKFRGELRRRRRRLEDLPDVRFVTATDDPDLAAEFDTFLDVEASGWKGETGSSSAIRLREGSLPFYQALLALRGDGDRCEIHALYAEGRCLASQLCMRTAGEFACLKIGYDETYSHLAPGLLLRQHLVDRCCQDPDITRMNWLTAAAWHRPWNPDTVALQQAYVAIGRWSGPLLIALLRLRLGPARRFVRWARGARRALAR